MAAYIIALLWAFAEATLFFIVPDVWISIVALKDKRKGLVACLFAVTGALIGGTIMFYWGQADIRTVNNILDVIPAIRITDIQKVQSELRSLGVVAVLFGPLFGIPYKIYAANAHSVISIIPFLLISIPARIVRFVLVALITPYATDRLLRNASSTRKSQIISIFWIIFYALYFYMKRD